MSFANYTWKLKENVDEELVTSLRVKVVYPKISSAYVWNVEFKQQKRCKSFFRQHHI